MRQILAIFSKDIRRFWPETGISWGLLLALVVVDPKQWQGNSEMIHVGTGWFAFAGGAFGFLGTCLIVLIPVSWWLLIARLIHCERLVGDTQFWITRPYAWPKLFSAKLLFLLAFVYAPFLAAQGVLLRECGFHPLSYVPGLLLNLFYLSVVLVLPLAAFAALTRGFGRMTLLLLSFVPFIVAVAVLSDSLSSNTFGSVPDILSSDLGCGILFCGFAAIVLVQYARHRVRLAWLLLVAVGAGISGIVIFNPDQALMNRHYRPGTPPVKFVYAPGGLTTQTNSKDFLSISIPVHESGVAEGEAVIPVALKTALEIPGGARWESSWQGITFERYLPGTSDATVRFVIPRAVYDRFRSVGITLRLTYALAVAGRESVTNVALPRGEFSVAGFGVCKPQSFFGAPDDYSQILCRSAMNAPRLTYITAHWSDGSCSAPNPGAHLLGTGWAGELDPAPAEFGITSVWNTPVNISNPWMVYQEGGQPRLRSLCPGSQVTFEQYRENRRMQMETTVSGFHIPELSVGDRYVSLHAR
jgi:hypothetical protein